MKLTGNNLAVNFENIFTFVALVIDMKAIGVLTWCCEGKLKKLKTHNMQSGCAKHAKLLFHDSVHYFTLYKN
jgi:hypothetical protein